MYVIYYISYNCANFSFMLQLLVVLLHVNYFPEGLGPTNFGEGICY
jgi:hypothetical protein